MNCKCSLTLMGAALLLPSICVAADGPLREQAEQSLQRATDFFRNHVSAGGGYLWRYSEDLSKREGEGRVGAQTVWVQPPGTPSVGMALLEAYEATGDKRYLTAATETGTCLVRGQLRSGGWDYRIEVDPKNRERYAYRVDSLRASRRNTTTLDDNTTQHALRFLMKLDKTLDFKNAAVHEAAEFALESLLKAQYAIGAWPQRFDTFPDPRQFPIERASHPESWSRTYPEKTYRGFYTFNDNAIADVIDVMFIAARTYKQPKYREAAERAGEFILLAQMPEPQPAWAQQYDADMHPAWARKFEPPAITGGESQGVMRTLLALYRETGNQRYLDPIPRAIKYLRRSQLSDGRLARFYELQTNKPLYFTRQYELTYKDDDLPTHYSFKVGSRLESIEREYQRLKQLAPEELKQRKALGRPKLTESLKAETREAIAALDKQGRWVEEGRLRYHGTDDDTRRVIDSRTFIRNAGILSRYLAATRK